MFSRSCLALGAATAALSTGALRSASAEAAVVQCLARGPCKVADTIELLQRPGANTSTDMIVGSNFGLLYPAPGGGWEFVCDDTFAGGDLLKARVDTAGRVLVPSLGGLFVTQDGCSWTRAAGTSDDRVRDVVLDPHAPGRVWMLRGDPRSITVSDDGGATFTTKHTFEQRMLLLTLAVAPSDPRYLYVGGWELQIPFILASSTDGGDTWTVDEKAAARLGDSARTADILGVAPDDPQTVYLAVGDERSDQIWKWTTREAAPVKLLTMFDGASARGLAFGATAQTLYVVGTDTLETAGKPPARLYVSRDGGKTWEDRPSSDKGPRYRCIHQRDGKLYACAGDAPAGDPFLVGVSSDEGATWTPLVRMADVRGVRACVTATCAATSSWLCDSYGICNGAFGDGGLPPLRDAGAEAPAPRTGHGCAYGGRARPFTVALGILAARLLRRRRRQAFGRGSA